MLSLLRYVSCALLAFFDGYDRSILVLWKRVQWTKKELSFIHRLIPFGLILFGQKESQSLCARYTRTMQCNPPNCLSFYLIHPRISQSRQIKQTAPGHPSIHPSICLPPIHPLPRPLSPNTIPPSSPQQYSSAAPRRIQTASRAIGIYIRGPGPAAAGGSCWGLSSRWDRWGWRRGER